MLENDYMVGRGFMATMKDVAELAGVSNAAVSRYLNGGYISDEKAASIKAAIDQTGYVPSNQARALRTGSTKLIGVIVPKINSESVSRITAGIGQVLSAKGYQMLLANTANDEKKEVEFLELFQNQPVDGIILVATVITSAHKKFFKNATVPVVLLGQRAQGVSCVYHDDAGAAKALGEAIVERIKGCVGYIGVTRDDAAAGVAREDNFTAAFEAAGRPIDAAHRRVSSFTTESGYACAKDLLQEHPNIQFIACATDTIAAGALNAMNEVLGGGVASFRVSGFGDNAFLRTITGGIYTVHFGYLTSGIEAANMVLEAIESGVRTPKQLMLGFEIMVPERV